MEDFNVDSKNQDIKLTPYMPINKNVNGKRIAIIYVYYEKKNEQKNQTNLAFFIKHGLDNPRWRKMNTDTLFIINDKQCEVMIPKDKKIRILPRDYNGEYDIGSYKIGINYFEKRYKKKFYELFDYLFIINCGVFGPICEPNGKNHWLDPFLNKISKENAYICSPVINFLKEDDAGGPGPRCQSYCSLIRITPLIYNLLLNTKISNLAEGTKNRDYKLESDFILKKHNKKHNIILIGEYGLTRVFLKNKLKICCLIYDNINYFDKSKWKKYSHRVDRKENYTPEYYGKAIFIKNNWIISKNLRDSYPVFYNKCIGFLEAKCNYKDPLLEINYKKNYELLNIAEEGSIHKRTEKWIGKKSFYKQFGYSEEHIVWPKKDENNKSCVIYCHYDKDNIIKDYVIQSLKAFMILGYDIVFCTTSSSIKNVDLPFKIKFFQNSQTIKAGNDILMWSKILDKKDLSNYEWILLANDSILLPIHGIENMRKSITEMRSKNDFWGLYLSCEYVEHLCSCFVEYNQKSIKQLKEFYKNMIPKCKTTDDIIMEIEIKQTQVIAKKNLRYNGIIRHEPLSKIRSIMFHPVNIHKYLSNNRCFGIKWKYIGNYINYKGINNPYLNYLMRYLKVSNKFIPTLRYYKWKVLPLPKYIPPQQKEIKKNIKKGKKKK